MSDNELDVFVRITYNGAKAAALVQSNLRNALAVLKADLTTLGVCHPKSANVKVLYPGCLEFFHRTLAGSVSSRSLLKRWEVKLQGL
jgi:hypothetical protein